MHQRDTKNISPASDDGFLLKLELYSDPQLLCVVRGALERLTEVFGFAPPDRRSVTRAVDEALTNIMRHCYNGRTDQPIEVYCRRVRSRASQSADGLEILLCDQGPPVDPSKLRGRRLDEIKPGGLGLHFIRQSMDTVSFGWSSTSSHRRSRAVLDYPKEGSVQISARHTDNATIFDVTGDIDLANSPEVRKALLREVREKRTPRVVMNLTKVRYIDSSGVASLVEGLKASRDLNLRFILFGLSASAREVLQLSRLLKIFEVYDNEDQALSSSALPSRWFGNQRPRLPRFSRFPRWPRRLLHVCRSLSRQTYSSSARRFASSRCWRPRSAHPFPHHFLYRLNPRSSGGLRAPPFRRHQLRRRRRGHLHVTRTGSAHHRHRRDWPFRIRFRR